MRVQRLDGSRDVPADDALGVREGGPRDRCGHRALPPSSMRTDANTDVGGVIGGSLIHAGSATCGRFVWAGESGYGTTMTVHSSPNLSWNTLPAFVLAVLIPCNAASAAVTNVT